LEVSGNFTPRLPPRKEPQYFLDRRLRGSRVGVDEWSREKSFASAGNRTLVVQPITHHYTELSRLPKVKYKQNILF
jgi:hypothetical protein